MTKTFTALPARLQDASPAVAHACLRIERFMRETLGLTRPWPACVAAVSGGADSCAMLIALRLLDVPLIVAHLDHALRPESRDDARYVADLALALALPCECARDNVAAVAAARKIGLEDAGRRLRYAFLEQVRIRHGAQWIVTAHHLDDLCEDVLLRLIRGSGWPALGGMPARDDGRRILRPLLHTQKKTLRAMLRALNLSWREDAGNQSRAARRNRIRHDLLPLIRRENPSFDQAVRRLWHMARLDAHYWRTTLAPSGREGEFRQEETGMEQEFVLDSARLDSLHPAARMRLYLECVHRLRARVGQKDARVPQARMDGLVRLDALHSARRTGTEVRLPGLRARVVRGGIRFEPAPGNE
jgi:tRNA(Ile)-lysidine synthase